MKTYEMRVYLESVETCARLGNFGPLVLLLDGLIKRIEDHEKNVQKVDQDWGEET